MQEFSVFLNLFSSHCQPLLLSFLILCCSVDQVVAPLLALLLANGTNMVIQIVPHALLEFTRTVMQERFSAVVKKGVLTFSFSRYQSVTPGLFSALIQAKEKKAVVLATPTSIKSVFLKVRIVNVFLRVFMELFALFCIK